MIDMGFLIKQRRPLMPAYLLRQPADHSRTTYSVPKNSTSTISCGAQCKHRAKVTWIHWCSNNDCQAHAARVDVEVDKGMIRVRCALRLILKQTIIINLRDLNMIWTGNDRCVRQRRCRWSGNTGTTGPSGRWIRLLMTAHIGRGSMEEWLEPQDEMLSACCLTDKKAKQSDPLLGR